MKDSTKKLLTGMAGLVASAAATAYVTKLLNDKPLSLRAEETKTTIADYIEGLCAFLRKNK